jgi:hypothetical protein
MNQQPNQDINNSNNNKGLMNGQRTRWWDVTTQELQKAEAPPRKIK